MKRKMMPFLVACLCVAEITLAPSANAAVNHDYALKWGVTDQAKADQCWKDLLGDDPWTPAIELPADSPRLPCPRALVTEEDVAAAKEYYASGAAARDRAMFNLGDMLLNILGFLYLPFAALGKFFGSS